MDTPSRKVQASAHTLEAWQQRLPEGSHRGLRAMSIFGCGWLRAERNQYWSNCQHRANIVAGGLSAALFAEKA